MPNRAARFLPALLFSFLAGVALTAASDGAARAADECIAAPKGQPPQGGHWYYRIERTTKRHCWYVRSEGPASAQAIASKPEVPPAMATLQPSVADARAELAPAPEPGRNIGAASSAAAAVFPNAPASTTVQPDPQTPNAQRWTLASRWSDQSGANDPAEPVQSTATAEAKPPAQPAVVAAAAAKQTNQTGGSVWMLVTVLAGALAIAGIATAVTVNVARNRPLDPDELRSRRRAIWATVDDEAILPSVAPRDETPNWIRIARETQQVRSRSHEIEDLLARSPRRSAV